MDSSLTFRAGIKDVIPTVFGYIGVGLAMGIVANTSICQFGPFYWCR